MQYCFLKQARRIAEIINAGIQPIQNLAVLNRIAELTGDNDKKAEWGHEWIEKGFVGKRNIATVS